MSNTRREIEVMPPISGHDYRIQDDRDALSIVQGMESGIKAIKSDVKQHQVRDALRHCMQLGQSIVELQAYLLSLPQ